MFCGDVIKAAVSNKEAVELRCEIVNSFYSYIITYIYIPFVFSWNLVVVMRIKYSVEASELSEYCWMLKVLFEYK